MTLTRPTQTVLLDMLEDVDGKARLAIARRIASDPRSRVRLAASPACPPAVLAELATDTQATVRKAAAAHPKLPAASRELLCHDKAASVREAACAAIGAAPVRVVSENRHAYTEDNVTKVLAAIRAGWYGWDVGAGRTTYALNRLVEHDPRWAADMRVLDALLGHAQHQRTIAVLTSLFEPRVVAERIAAAYTARPPADVVDVDEVFEALAEAISPDNPAEQVEVIESLLAPHLAALAARRGKARPCRLFDALTSHKKKALAAAVEQGGIAAALAARREVLGLPALLDAATEAFFSGGGYERPTGAILDAAERNSPLLVAIAQQLQEHGDAAELVAAGDPVPCLAAMAGLLPGLRETAFLVAAHDSSGDELLAYAAVAAADLPPAARLALAGHEDYWLRRHVLSRPDCTGADVVAAVAAGTELTGALIARLDADAIGLLPWQTVRTHPQVRKAMSARMAPVFATNPGSVDVLAAMCEAFDGTIDEMVDAARLL